MNIPALDMLAAIRGLGRMAEYFYADGTRKKARAVISPGHPAAGSGGDLGQLNQTEWLYIGLPEIPLEDIACIQSGSEKFYPHGACLVYLGDIHVYTRAVLKPYGEDVCHA